MSEKRDLQRDLDRAEAEWWEAEVVKRLHDRAKKAEARVVELEARLQAAERVVHAARLAREELRHAPCRDNPQHTLCLKCAAERALDEALAAWEEAKQC